MSNWLQIRLFLSSAKMSVVFCIYFQFLCTYFNEGSFYQLQRCCCCAVWKINYIFRRCFSTRNRRYGYCLGANLQFNCWPLAESTCCFDPRHHTQTSSYSFMQLVLLGQKCFMGAKMPWLTLWHVLPMSEWSSYIYIAYEVLHFISARERVPVFWEQ